MSDFKDTSRAIRGHHDWNGTHIQPRAEVFPPSGGDRIQGNAAVQRGDPPTRELQEHGGRSPLNSGYAKGGPTKHFHVHKHFHAKGGKVRTESRSYRAAEKGAEQYAGENHVHDSTEIPAGVPDYKKGGMHINPKHRGLFTKKMTGSKSGKLTGKDVKRGLHSKSPTTRKEANFARMARRGFKPLHRNAGGAIYATGGTVNELALGGMPAQTAPMGMPPGRLAQRPAGLPSRAGPALRRPMPLPGPQPVMRAQGGAVPAMERVAKKVVREHIHYPAPQGHKGLGEALKRR